MPRLTTEELGRLVAGEKITTFDGIEIALSDAQYREVYTAVMDGLGRRIARASDARRRELVELVRVMRQSQREYFADRSHERLRAAKAAEAAVDAAVKADT